MKKNKIFLALFLVLLLSVSLGQYVFAGPIMFNDNNKLTIVYSKKDKANGYFVGFMKSFEDYQAGDSTQRSIKNVKINVADSSIVKIKTTGNNALAFTVYPKKVGKTKITLTAKINGKKKTYKGTIIVRKFVNPFKMIKVNGQSILNKIKGGLNYNIKVKNLVSGQQPVYKYKLKSGWKVFSSAGNVLGVENKKTGAFCYLSVTAQ